MKMHEDRVVVITGAGRGLGVDIVKAVLTAGHAVVATGRDASKVAAAVGRHDNLLAIKLDVTHPQDAQAATLCSPGLKPTASCPPPSRTTPPNQKGETERK